MGSSQNIPYWVKSWLENYNKAKFADNIIEEVQTICGENMINKFKTEELGIIFDFDVEFEEKIKKLYYR